MGLFGKLFEKKICDICGREIGLFGNNKLENGNMCDDCRRKLSPFYEDIRHTTIKEINRQLDYREENKRDVERFTVTARLGKNEGVVMLDEDHGALVALRDNRMDWRRDNPDVIRFEDVVACTVDVDENERREEILCRDRNGNMVSYNPPRYDSMWEYEVYVNIAVRHPFIERMRIKINEQTIKTDRQGRSRELEDCTYVADDIRDALMKLRRQWH